MINPEARKRLAGHMDQRRVGLRLTWREVAEAAGISYEALRTTRSGPGGIAPLTEAGIEDALQWERGSIRRILDGGDPVPLTISLREPHRAPPDGPLAAIYDNGGLLTSLPASFTALVDPEEQAIRALAEDAARLEARQRGVPLETVLRDIPSGVTVFGRADPQSARWWDDYRAMGLLGEPFTIGQLIRMVAITRVKAAQQQAAAAS